MSGFGLSQLGKMSEKKLKNFWRTFLNLQLLLTSSLAIFIEGNYTEVKLLRQVDVLPDTAPTGTHERRDRIDS